MKTFTLMTAISVTTATPITVPAVTVPGLNLRGIADDGIFSVYLVTSAGTVQVQYLLSFDGATFLTPSGATDIVAGFTVGSDIISFEPELAPYMRLKVIATDATAVTTLILAVQ